MRATTSCQRKPPPAPRWDGDVCSRFAIYRECIQSFHSREGCVLASGPRMCALSHQWLEDRDRRTKREGEKGNVNPLKSPWEEEPRSGTQRIVSLGLARRERVRNLSSSPTGAGWPLTICCITPSGPQLLLHSSSRNTTVRFLSRSLARSCSRCVRPPPSLADPVDTFN